MAAEPPPEAARPRRGSGKRRALRGTVRMVRELGPAAFLLREDGRRGPPLRGGAARSAALVHLRHRSSGSGALRAPLLMLLSWVFLKEKLRRYLSDCIRNQHKMQNKLLSQTPHEENDRCIHQKEIDEKDVCPICQEELLKKMLPITYCRYSCGNNVHVKCMKIWADHQDETEKDSVVKCPLCREKFAPLELIPEEFRNSDQLVTATEKARLDRHLGIPCSNCRVFPIVGKCYKCTGCAITYAMNVSLVSAILHVFLFRQDYL